MRFRKAETFRLALVEADIMHARVKTDLVLAKKLELVTQRARAFHPALSNNFWTLAGLRY